MAEGATGRFTDADRYETSLPDCTAEIVVTQSGRFEAQLTWAKLPSLHLLRAQEALARVAYIALPAAVAVSFSARPGPGLVWDGVELGAGDLVLHSVGERLHQRTTGPSQWGSLFISPAFFDRYGSALAGYRLAPPSLGRVVRPLPENIKRLVRLHARVARLVETRPIAIWNPEVGRALEQELLEALVTCLTGCRPHGGPGPSQEHVQSMARVEAILAARPGQVRQAKALCQLIGISGQALRACCAAFLGISPEQYLLLRRLKLVRAAMLRDDEARVRVRDIARRYGFTDAARFSEAYQMAFGEKPSATPARRRNVI